MNGRRATQVGGGEEQKEKLVQTFLCLTRPHSLNGVQDALRVKGTGALTYTAVRRANHRALKNEPMKYINMHPALTLGVGAPLESSKGASHRHDVMMS